MPAPAIIPISDAVAEAAALAMALVTRTLKLADRRLTDLENGSDASPKDLADCVSTIKRAADALKVLARIPHQPPAETAPQKPAAHPAEPGAVAVPVPAVPGVPMVPPQPAGPASPPAKEPIPTPAPAPPSGIPARKHPAQFKADLRRLERALPQPPLTRSYGESLSRR